ncbi:hypothetical protein C5C17_07520 [Pseudoclavibacter sp. RFBA6]|nr:hypothetical protein C5C17_07520 [Pseudoclavibacter sp. RFBA6]
MSSGVGFEGASVSSPYTAPKSGSSGRSTFVVPVCRSRSCSAANASIDDAVQPTSLRVASSAGFSSDSHRSASVARNVNVNAMPVATIASTHSTTPPNRM